MSDVIVGVAFVAIGVLFTLRGYQAMRLVIPVWGAFAGFLFGAGVVDAATDEGFLGHVAGWVVGVVVAIGFSALAYAYYEVSVLIGMAAIGFALGTTATVAAGVTWSWVVVLVGVAVATILAAVAIVGDLPMLLLTVLTALAGASTVVAGLMLWAGTLSADDLGSAPTTERLDDSWWWYAIFVAMAIIGIVAQLRSTERLRTSLRAAWAHDGGRSIRARA